MKNQLCSSEQEILELKAALWAVGHIGTSVSGVEWLANEGIIQCVTTIAQGCPVYSLRATAFYSIGLLATTVAGSDLLALLGKVSLEAWVLIFFFQLYLF